MALTERGRAVPHRTLGPIIGDEEVTAEMLSSLATDASELATKDFVRAEIATAVNQLTFRLVGVMLAQTGFLLAVVGLR